MKKIFLAAIVMASALCSTAQSDSLSTPLWMRFPAISPDGYTIAFGYQGDIYTVPVQGGEAKRLTVHEAYESHPIWSPDGTHIAFASKRYGNDDIFIMPATGDAPKRLTFHSANDTPYDFSPDGESIIYGSSRVDDHRSVLFPSGVLPELYQVNVTGGKERQLLTTPAEMVRYSSDGGKLVFHDRKGYEDPYRKHHTSSVTRDLWMYDLESETYSHLTERAGEDRNPVWDADDRHIFFLSERSGSFNVWKAEIIDGKAKNFRQVSSFETHPVRSLSRSNDGVLCYSYNGEIYTQLDGQAPKKVDITLHTDRRYNEAVVELIKGNAGEFTVSPNGKEIAFIVRGEVFVTSIDYSHTKRITDTPEQERNLDFNSDGTKLLYSGERNGSWNIYEATLGRPEDKYFFNATIIEEKPIVETEAETFQPSYSPDDKEVAFLEDRTTLRVKNLESGEIRTVLPGHYNYSYVDGDQYYTWSPDGKWLLVNFFDHGRWNGQVGIVKSTGEEEPINLTQSGYENSRPKFGMDGEVIYWSSDKNGYRSHGSWGSQSDVMALFLTVDAHKRFTLDKSDYAIWKENRDKEKEDEEDDDKKDKKKKDEESKETKPVVIEWDGLQDRKERLTIFSSFLADFLLDSTGENLYYLARTDKGYDLWKTNFKEKETKVLSALSTGGSSIEFGEEEKHIFLNAGGTLKKVKVDDGKTENISFSSEMNLNKDAERAYMFEHAWRQFRDKFYLTDLHNVDWDMYKEAYERFLPHVNNPYDFADLLSELLGEANASHTGGRYFHRDAKNDQTAALGALYDQEYEGAGLKIVELLPKSPLLEKDRKVQPGTIIEKIDGHTLKAGENHYPLLNRKAGEKTLISFHDPKSGKRWDAVVEPITTGQENGLLYERWVKTREAAVDSLSGGRLGYVHVRGMNSPSFRKVFDQALGKFNMREGLVVDTRFNGGGWLHDDLLTFLDGEPYLQFLPRGQDNMGGEPLNKWQKPSVVIMSEGNYSDAFMFPYAYKFFDIGKLVGMPVPGTGTAVWWETMLDGTVFGIPQIGMRDVRTGVLMENHQLEPDIKVANEPGKASRGVDQQLKAAVEHLLGE